MRVYLLGYMGSGKSTFGPKLAGALNLHYIDLDEEFESRYKTSINDFFTKYGEKLFRELEHKLLETESLEDDILISTGGGTPCYPGNLELMNNTGITVYLEVPFEILISRLLNSRRKRPLLQSFSGEGFETQVREHLIQREVFYRQAHITTSGTSPDAGETAASIAHIALTLSAAK